MHRQVTSLVAESAIKSLLSDLTYTIDGSPIARALIIIGWTRVHPINAPHHSRKSVTPRCTTCPAKTKRNIVPHGEKYWDSTGI